MSFAKKSKPLVTETFISPTGEAKAFWHTDEPSTPFLDQPAPGYYSDYSRPTWATDLPEHPNPGLKNFNCPKCGTIVQVQAHAECEIWHYRGICPNCDQTWSLIKTRFAKPKPLKAKKDAPAAPLEPDWNEEQRRDPYDDDK